MGLTANELWELWSPVWTKVPECKPTHSGFDYSEATQWGDPPTFRLGVGWDDSGSGRVHGDLDDDAAAALCRMAAIEWLRSKGRLELMPRFMDSTCAESVKITLPEPLDHLLRPPVYMRTAPTFDAALAAAVIAVGGGK